MERRGGAREVIDLVDLDLELIDHVVLHEPEPVGVCSHTQLCNILEIARIEVIQADHVMSICHQSSAKMRTKKARTTGD